MSITTQNLAETSHILGIDFGMAKIGLALADLETKIAYAYKTIDNDKNLSENLRKIIELEDVKNAVIGRPNYVHANVETRLIASLQKLTDDLKTMGIRVDFQDESFTTKMAEANLKEKGMKKLKMFDNEEAARIILQDWLDK